MVRFWQMGCVAKNNKDLTALSCIFKDGDCGQLRHMQSEGHAARSWPSAACHDCHSLLAILVIGTHCCSFSRREASLRHHTVLFLDPKMVLPPCHERSCKYNCFSCQMCLMFRFLSVCLFLFFLLLAVSLGVFLSFFISPFYFFLLLETTCPSMIL